MRSSVRALRRRSCSRPSRTTSSRAGLARRPSARRGATRTSLASRSSGSSAQSDGARPIPDGHDHVYDAFRRERSNGAKLPTLKPSAVRAYAADVRERSLDVLERIDLDAPDVARPPRVRLRRSSSRTSSSRRSRCSRRCSPAPDSEYPVVDAAAPDRAPGGPTEIDVPGGIVHARRGARAVGIRQRARAARDGAPALPHRPCARHERRVRRVRRRRVATAHASTGATTGWAWREREDVTAPLYWERSSDGWERDPLRPTRADHAVGARPARLLLRGRGVRSLGGKAAADRDRVGARRGLARPRGEVPVPMGPGVDGLRGEPRSPALLPRSGRLVCRRRQPSRVRPDGGGRLGVDVVGASSPTRASSRSRTPSAPR